MAFDFIKAALAARRKDNLFRQVTTLDSAVGALIEVGGQYYLNFSSNDYLGMRQSTAVMQGWVDGIGQFGGGSGASPLVTGHTQAHQALQDYLAGVLGRDAVLLFNSGFAANQALCQALFQLPVSQKSASERYIVADKLMHASLLEGAMGSDATLRRFAHNDCAHLQKQLDKIHAGAKSTAQDILLVTEGVYSMDGDEAPLSELAIISEQHKSWLMVDDAHGFGVLGKTGMGAVEKHGLNQEQVPVLMATFGKAIGTAGAFVSGSQDLIDYLTNFAKHYIYSTAMPPAQAVATLASLHTIEQSEQRALLHDNIAYFRQLATAAGIALTPSMTAIQPIIIGSPELAIAISQRLRNMGLWVSAIRTPTVPKGTDRLRITLSASHHKKDIQALVDGLILVMERANEAEFIGEKR
ncbi:8-amino-7-oxononanoate synthase [uncultured Paraglaciecola sp.]|uniref:aminotransferase class I/II-fold pyridoxal phosphate-dependent enzyme n=1 Tax=uncultured Paraglaciecola sp. TaxID=1765024 RepID=UPI0030D813AE|tara:strand:- start:91 stop:1323 length:1233 start_codon:yes stop_codon:yes gene_type:complete